MPAPVTVNPIQKCMRLLVTSHGRNRQHNYAIRASGNHQKETMDVFFTHKWTWAHQKRRSDQRNAGSGTIQTIWAV